MANASSGRRVDGNVLEPDHRDFSSSVEYLTMISSSRKRSRIDVIRIEQTRGNFTADEGDLLFNVKNIDRQTHIHHRNIFHK